MKKKKQKKKQSSGRTFCNCTRCVHGMKPITPQVCGPCILKKKSHFRDRGKVWPQKDIHIEG